MRERERGLGQDEAEERVVRFDASPVGVVDEVVVIRFGVVAGEAEAESAFPCEGSVATSCVAAAFGENGEDVAVKALWVLGGGIPHGDRDGGRISHTFEADRGGAVGNGAERSGGVDGGHTRIFDTELWVRHLRGG